MHTIVFDFGNVIYPFDRKPFIKKLAENSPKTEEEVREVYPGSDLNRRHARGEITFSEFYGAMKKKLGLNMKEEEFREAYCKLYTTCDVNTDVIKLIEKLHRNYRLQLFSDTNTLHYERIMKTNPIYHCFDAETISFKVGALKTEDKSYLDVIEKAGCPAKEIVFIDDKEEYARKAEEMRMHGIHFRNYGQLIQDLRDLGVEV